MWGLLWKLSHLYPCEWFNLKAKWFRISIRFGNIHIVSKMGLVWFSFIEWAIVLNTIHVDFVPICTRINRLEYYAWNELCNTSKAIQSNKDKSQTKNEFNGPESKKKVKMPVTLLNQDNWKCCANITLNFWIGVFLPTCFLHVEKVIRNGYPGNRD